MTRLEFPDGCLRDRIVLSAGLALATSRRRQLPLSRQPAEVRPPGTAAGAAGPDRRAARISNSRPVTPRRPQPRRAPASSPAWCRRAEGTDRRSAVRESC